MDNETNEYIRDLGFVSENASDIEEIGHKSRVSTVKFLPESKFGCISGGWDRYKINSN